MAHIKHKLTPAYLERKSKVPGAYGDGGGLWLYVSTKTASSWVFRYMLRGNAREMGLGPYPDVPLNRARDKAEEARRLKADGSDPIEFREFVRAAQRLEAARAITFKNAAEQYIASHKAGWRNDKHAEQWGSTLETYVYPIFGDVSVAAVDVALVTKALEPIWTVKGETAARVRGRIERILDWASARGYRQGENPARWRGHLDKLLAPQAKVRRVKHHAALPYRELSDFLAKLKGQEGTGASALQFAILTGARTGEIIGATWPEIDLDNAVWTVPADRMKGGREHRVPLSKPALTILRGQHKASGGEGFVFPGMRARKPLSNMALLATLHRMGRDDLTTHGFRSTFRDWAAEQTAFPREVAEAALAHALESKVEAAYRRGDLFEKRAKLMNAWATFCTTAAQSGAKVVPIKGRAAQHA